MRVAIYSRKSKFTGKGDSVENQVRMCQNYLETHYPNDYDPEKLIILEDEGFSGGNTDRPSFKKLMKLVETGEIDLVVCYKLDRISRSITDFAALIEKFNRYQVKFIATSQNFGDSGPMAKLMMFIASVFSDFERSVIAERIRDNMLELAKTGRWLGGVVPLGYSSEEVSMIDFQGKERKCYKLSPLPEEVSIVQFLYAKYLEWHSLSHIESYLLTHHIYTKNGNNYSRFAIRSILSNPVYAIADLTLYNYFIEQGCQVYNALEKYNGSNGIMPYNRTEQVKGDKKVHRYKDKSEWVIAVGTHKGVISSSDWLRVQFLLEQNSSKMYRKVKSSEALLSGLLICKNCGSYLRPKLGRVNKKGEKSFYYICEKKEKSKGQLCSIHNANGLLLDHLIMETLHATCFTTPELAQELTLAEKKIGLKKEEYTLQEDILHKHLENNKKAISNLITTLSQMSEPSIIPHLIEKISTLEADNKEIEGQLKGLSSLSVCNTLKEEDFVQLKEQFLHFDTLLSPLTPCQKQQYLSLLLEKIEWDGDNATLHFFGPKSTERLQKMFPDGDYSK